MDSSVHPTVRPVTIEPDDPPLAAAVAEIWDYRELLGTLVGRELRLRYAQTWVGVAWVVLKPLLTMALVWGVFGIAADLPADGMSRPVFFFSGLIVWFFVSGAITDSQNSLVINADLIRKVYFPRLLLPLATVLARLVDLSIMLACLGVLLAVTGTPAWPSFLTLLSVTLVTTLLATALGLITAAVNVKYRDTTHAVPVVAQLWMFASPIVYSSRLVPADWAWVYALNPLVGLIDGFRAALMGRPLDERSLLPALATTGALVLASVWIFRRLDASFADFV